jgi:hypothetical protein
MTRSDREHLRTLAICHYVLGGLCFLIGLFPMFHLALGIAIVTGLIPMQPQGNGNAPPFPAELFGWFFIGIASAVIAFYWALGLALVQAGTCLRQARWRTFCIVVAGFSCLFQPLGTILGVFTIIVLMRPSVRDAFEPSPGGTPKGPKEDDHDRYYSD